MDRRKSWESSLVHVAVRINVEVNDRFRPEKSALLSFPAIAIEGPASSMVKES
jgi:hypothetical protein